MFDECLLQKLDVMGGHITSARITRVNEDGTEEKIFEIVEHPVAVTEGPKK